jgi:malonate transporter
LFRFGSTTPLASLFDPVVAALWLLCGAVVIALAAWLARARGAGWPDAAMGALVAGFPNSGFMGVPLILALLGDAGVGPVMATLLVDLVVTTSVCIGLSQWGAADEHGPVKAVLRALKGVARNPMPWSILLGAAAGMVGLTLWAPLGKTIGLLADAASPVALFTIGAVLARSQMHARVTGDRGAHLRDEPWLAGIKLLLHPLLVWGLGWVAVRQGWLAPTMLVPLVMAAALPAASNVSLLAERFGADNGRVARVILWSTALAFFTFSGLVALLR